jgi:hypothetical protein
VKGIVALGYESLSPTILASLQEFQTAGGLVIKGFHDGEWDSSFDALAAQRELLAALLSATDRCKVSVQGGGNAMHSNAFLGEGRLAVALVNDFSWVVANVKRIEKRRGRPVPDGRKDVPAPVLGVRVRVMSRTSPKAVFNAVDGNFLPYDFANGLVDIAVPSFKHMALVVVLF